MLRAVRLRAVASSMGPGHTRTELCYGRVHTNAIGIQMLPDKIWRRVFPRATRSSPTSDSLKQIENHLRQHDLWGRKSDCMPDVPLDVPELAGADIEEHFRNIGDHYTRPYLNALHALINSPIPTMPTRFAFHSGWVCYAADGQSFEPVEAPEGDAIVFDVETIVKEGGLPAMATALSDSRWYSWCSPALVEGRSHRVERVTPNELIPLGQANREQVVVGHNAGFDRSFVKEEYNMKLSKRRFLDTLSLHVCVSGRTNSQKMDTLGTKDAKQCPDESWKTVSAMNKLSDVHQFYCGEELSKAMRKTFEKGCSDDVRADFQDLMKYCIGDVKATRDVLVKLLPLFLERSPHPVSLFGIMEMLTAYLPVNANWTRYLAKADEVYEDMCTEMKLVLHRAANEACRLGRGGQYKQDPWLWDLDWTTQAVKFKRKFTTQPQARQPFMCGYPKWYRDLCDKLPTEDLAELAKFEFGAWNISTQMQCVPKLLKLMWDGYPLHFNDEHGWGYLIPNDDENICEIATFPLEAYRAVLQKGNRDEDWMKKLEETRDTENDEDRSTDGISTMKRDFKKPKATKKPKNTDAIDIGIPGTLFMRLQHRGGSTSNVGNPLGKEFTSKLLGGELRAWGYPKVDRLVTMARQVIYWKNSRDRLREQMVVWVNETDGVILPRLMPAGTVTRRAVEKTWLTASNAKLDRIGSELKTMVQAPDGRHFVGADVDSQELWIASLFGDAAFEGIHGCTAFGWMTLQGKRADATDMHSRTAAAAGCTRDQAKVLNYARIYGAREQFAATLLKEFNPQLTTNEAKLRAKKMFELTKGRRLAVGDRKQYLNTPDIPQESGLKMWVGGTESHMFNRLEKEATSDQPCTAVLKSRITRALEPEAVRGSYMRSRINWVVQSSAVDYLHLMLASMRYLLESFGMELRLIVSIHDEVRFMVRSEDRYRAALALHITNLLVRAIFARAVGMEDLPLSVAFFSAVDVDKVLRKEVTDDSITPSNPHGLRRSYGVPFGEALDIYRTIELTSGGKLTTAESECRRMLEELS